MHVLFGSVNFKSSGSLLAALSMQKKCSLRHKLNLVVPQTNCIIFQAVRRFRTKGTPRSAKLAFAKFCPPCFIFRAFFSFQTCLGFGFSRNKKKMALPWKALRNTEISFVFKNTMCENKWFFLLLQWYIKRTKFQILSSYPKGIFQIMFGSSSAATTKNDIAKWQKTFWKTFANMITNKPDEA